jgi:hypothetical protein
MIPRLLAKTGEVSEHHELMEHIYGFYQGLMWAKGEERVFSLAPNVM